MNLPPRFAVVDCVACRVPPRRAGNFGARITSLREVFEGIDDPRWDGGDATHPLRAPSGRFEPMKKITTPDEKIV